MGGTYLFLDHDGSCRVKGELSLSKKLYPSANPNPTWADFIDKIPASPCLI